MEFIKNIFGNPAQKALKKLDPLVAVINALEQEYIRLLDKEFAEKTATFKDRLAAGAHSTGSGQETLDNILPEAFALVREAARRTLGQRHYDVQLLGGIILHRSGIAEMRTGEGKTLVATLPVYLNALEGKGVHIITVNDYLSRRDAAWMGEIYAFLGLSVGVINHDSSYLYDPAQKASDQERDEMGSFRGFF